MSYVLGEDAELDLDSIWEFIAQDNIDAADRWMTKLFDAFEAIGNSPSIGHKREDLTDFPMLFLGLNTYLIIYRVTPQMVEILAVTQGGRDIPGFLLRRI